MMRSQSVRLARRAFSTEAKEAASSSAAAAAPASSGSSFGQRLLSFTIGFGLASGYGLYKINDDVEQSTHEIQTTIAALKTEVIAQNAALSKRIEQLEKRD